MQDLGQFYYYLFVYLLHYIIFKKFGNLKKINLEDQIFKKNKSDGIFENISVCQNGILIIY